ncbi:hypothetical protein [Actinacidiphila paucisporea]|uniref:SPOR domain-containing protein n=1 Tax=Actinacidiphila paucisporea TaxID=310782 RepID=A0A1M6UNB5_9ACTN|nr:hypothetical protein [Actinacidiphila paucisporea]SHK70681.1 hypothetical protein SAMN05216499_101427 [Actinacidiphila paucisporea]
MTSDLVWVLIRQDDGANRYRVGRYATRAEAERIADRLGGCGQDRDQERGGAEERRYVIERIAPRLAQA